MSNCKNIVRPQARSGSEVLSCGGNYGYGITNMDRHTNKQSLNLFSDPIRLPQNPLCPNFPLKIPPVRTSERNAKPTEPEEVPLRHPPAFPLHSLHFLQIHSSTATTLPSAAPAPASAAASLSFLAVRPDTVSLCVCARASV